jgi:DNA replication protein DnaC
MLDDERMANSNIPPLYQECTLENFRCEIAPDQLTRARFQVERWINQMEGDRGLILIGPVGSGKTHLATATLRLGMERVSLACGSTTEA